MSGEPGGLRKSVMVALIGIALSPISLVLGYYLNHALQAPRMQSQYARAVFDIEPQAVTPAVVDALKSNPRLSARFRAALVHVEGTERGTCLGWLNGEPWDEACLRAVAADVEGLVAATDADLKEVNAALETLEADTRSARVGPFSNPSLQVVPVLLAADRPAAITLLRGEQEAAARDMSTLSVLRAELDRVSQPSPQHRTGGAGIQVGILNAGDSDGVVFPEAVVRCAGSTVRYRSSGYVVVKSHSFEEITYEPNPDDSTAADVAKWETLIRNGAHDEFVIEVKTGGAALSMKGNLM